MFSRLEGLGWSGRKQNKPQTNPLSSFLFKIYLSWDRSWVISEDGGEAEQ